MSAETQRKNIDKSKDGPIVKDNVLGMYPNSVHLYMSLDDWMQYWF